MKIQPVLRPSLSSAILDQIREQILSGELAPGDLIPSERELAEGYEVNRATVREALTELTRLRLIARKQGRRCVVLDFRDSGSLELLAYILRLPQGHPVREEAAASFFDAIQRSYVTAIELISLGPADLGDVRVAVESLEEAIAARDARRVFKADRAFHRALFRAMGSLVVELMITPLFRAVDEGLDLGGSYGLPAAHEYVRRQSYGPRLPPRAIYDALASEDYAEAREVVRRTVVVMKKVFMAHAP